MKRVRLEAVRRYLELRASEPDTKVALVAARIAKEYEVDPSTIFRWVRRYGRKIRAEKG